MTRDPPLPLERRLRVREPTAGLIVKMPAWRQITIAADAGFDYVIIDCEHGPSNATQLEHHVAAAAAARIPVLVRVASLHPAAILQALDAGASGIVVPHVHDPTDAAAAMAAAHYPPRGRRSVAGSTQAGRYGAVPLADHIARAAEQTCVVAQIEDESALRSVDEIAAVPGITALFIGTVDLSVSAGWLDTDAAGRARLERAVRRVADAAAAHHTGAIAPVAAPPDGERWRRLGIASVVAVDTALTLAAYRGQVAATAPRPSAPPGEPIVLLPGMLCDGALWSEVQTRLDARRPTVVARVDLDETIGEMAETVLSVAPTRFAIAGHSLGAIVAAEVARRAPHRVSRMALINVGGRAPGPQQMRVWDAMEAEAFPALLARYPDQVLHRGARTDTDLRRHVTMMARAVGRDGLVRQLAAQRSRQDVRSLLADVSCLPALVIAGADDHVCSPDLATELADALPNAELRVLDGCGHMAPIERPDAVAGLLESWLGDHHNSRRSPQNASNSAAD